MAGKHKSSKSSNGAAGQGGEDRVQREEVAASQGAASAARLDTGPRAHIRGATEVLERHDSKVYANKRYGRQSSLVFFGESQPTAAMSLSNLAAIHRLSSSAALRLDATPSLMRQGTLQLINNLTEGPIPPTTEKVGHADSTGISLLYRTDWRTPFIHMRCDDGKWTSPPGVAMTEVVTTQAPDDATKGGSAALKGGQDDGEISDELRAVCRSMLASSQDGNRTTFWFLRVDDARSMEFVPNEKGAHWDHSPSGANYVVPSPGRHILHNGVVTEMLAMPGPPALIDVTDVTGSTATLAWNPPAFRCSLVTAYKVYRGPDVVATLDGDAMTFTDVGLAGLAQYVYTVSAVNAQGLEGPPTAGLNVYTGEPGKPSVPLHLQCTTTSKKHIGLSWRYPIDHGGAPVQCYSIYRDKLHLAYHPVTQKDIEEFEDQDVVSGRTYSYAVAAMNQLPKPPRHCAAYKDRSTPTEAVTGVDQSLGEHEGPCSDPIKAVCQEMLSLPRLGDSRSHIILQCFNWHSAEISVTNAPPATEDEEGGSGANRTTTEDEEDILFDSKWASWYKELLSQVEDMAAAGITMTWLPPPSQSVAPQGYMPTRWYNLSGAYGSGQQLRDLNGKFRSEGITPMLDLVVNHRCGVRQDSRGQWTQFEDPDWESWAIVKDNKQGYSGTSGVADTGSSSDCAPDLDHTNSRVRSDIVAWTKWLCSSDGADFGAIRIDMAPGYNVNYQLEYLEQLSWPFAVGEYWNGCADVLHNYCMRGGKGRLAAFDFAFYYVLRNCVESGDYGGMRGHDGKLNGLVGKNPDNAVTFLDNHDTEHLDFVGKFAGGDIDKVLMGYAILLTHPGVPSVFWSHWASADKRLRATITALGHLRRTAKISASSAVHICKAEHGLYAAMVSRYRHCSGHRDAHIAIKVGCHDWAPPNCEHEWVLETCGNNFAVWSKK